MNLRFLSGFAFAIVVFISTLGQATAQETVRDNTVRIKVGTSYGSGAYIGDGLVLSCSHLFRGEGTLNAEVWFIDGKHYAATAIGMDDSWDQSLIQLSDMPSLKGIQVATENPKPGDIVHAFGYGESNTITSTTGYVTKYVGNDNLANSSADWFELTGSVESGSSGGPIVNSDGYIIGNLWGTDGANTVGLVTSRTRRFLLPWKNRLSPIVSPPISQPAIPNVQYCNGICSPGMTCPPNMSYPPGMAYPPGVQVLPPGGRTQPSPRLVPLPQQQQLDIPLPGPSTTAPPMRQPNTGVCRPPCNCRPIINNPGEIIIDHQKIADLIKQDADFVASLKGEPGQDGAPGPAGQDGQPGQSGEITAEHLAAMTAAIIQNLKSDQEFLANTMGPVGPEGMAGVDGQPGPVGPQGPPGIQGEPGEAGEVVEPIPGTTTAWSHLVLIAPSDADYWPRLEDEYEKATGYYNMMRHVEPPADRNIGPMPVLVAYSGGKPARSWIGLRNVSQALTTIVRGEFDEFLLTTND